MFVLFYFDVLRILKTLKCVIAKTPNRHNAQGAHRIELAVFLVWIPRTAGINDSGDGLATRCLVESDGAA
jgi:hypothetical protein